MSQTFSDAAIAGTCSGMVVIMVTLIIAILFFIKVKQISKDSANYLDRALAKNPAQFHGMMHFACSDCQNCENKMMQFMETAKNQLSIRPTASAANSANSGAASGGKSAKATAGSSEDQSTYATPLSPCLKPANNPIYSVVNKATDTYTDIGCVTSSSNKPSEIESTYAMPKKIQTKDLEPTYDQV